MVGVGETAHAAEVDQQLVGYGQGRAPGRAAADEQGKKLGIGEALRAAIDEPLARARGGWPLTDGRHATERYRTAPYRAR